MPSVYLPKNSVIVGSALFLGLLVSCRHLPDQRPPGRSKDRDEVLLFMHSIAATVTANGPTAWLSFFDNSPSFVMANDGILMFHNYEEARKMITAVVANNIHKITLSYDNVRVDPLQHGIAGVAADFHEIITDASGKNISDNGYFTAIALLTSQGWKLRNVQWSSLHAN